jgi:hypothetical protein
LPPAQPARNAALMHAATTIAPVLFVGFMFVLQFERL